VALPPYYLEDMRLFELSCEASDEETGTPVPTIDPQALRPLVKKNNMPYLLELKSMTDN
jgi:hypothetical protein